MSGQQNNSWCQVKVGDVLNNSRYEIVHNLGNKIYSTVCAAKDTESNRFVTLKIAKSNVTSSNHELQILNHLAADPTNHLGKKNVIALRDSFDHQAPTGIHKCFVLEVLASSVKTYFQKMRQSNNSSSNVQSQPKIDLSAVKLMLRQVLLGLAFLHRHGVLHNDLHAGNVLVSIKGLSSIEEHARPDTNQENSPSAETGDSLGISSRTRSGTAEKRKAWPLEASNTKQAKVSHGAGHKSATPEGDSGSASESSTNSSEFKSFAATKAEQPETALNKNARIKIANLGRAAFLLDQSDDIDTLSNIRSPEMILGQSVSDSHDIWSFGCLIFEFITGRSLFMLKPGEYDESDDDKGLTGDEMDVEVDNADVANEIIGDSENKEVDQQSHVPGLNVAYLQQFACALGPLRSPIFGKGNISNPFFKRGW